MNSHFYLKPLLAGMLLLIMIIRCNHNPFSAKNDPFDNPYDPLNYVDVTIMNATTDCPREGLGFEFNRGYRIKVGIDTSNQFILIDPGKSSKIKLPPVEHRFWAFCEDGTTPIDSMSKKVVHGQDNTVRFPGMCNMCIPKPNGLLIDDFNDGKQINLLGLPHSIFKSPVTIRTIDTFYIRQPSKNVLRGTGGALRMEVDVTTPDSAFGGWLTTLSDSQGTSLNLKLLNLHALTFWVKADIPEINLAPEINIEVALIDSNSKCEKGCQTEPKVIRPVKTFWQKVRIPASTLLMYREVGLDSTRVREINFAFGYKNIGPTGQRSKVTVYLDEIAFER